MTYTWSIKLFAGLPERIGVSSLSLRSEEGQMTAMRLKEAVSAAYPEHGALIRVSFIACNHAYAADDKMLLATDELALLPPVSGGEESQAAADGERDDLYVVTDEPIRSDDVLAKVIVPEHGAAIAFVGTTREWTQGKRTVRLEYEAYAPMAVATMKQIGDEIAARWQGALCAISHRIGVVGLAETSVVIAVSSPHRDICYEASRYAIERLKQIVPIWKKEIWEDGSEWKGHQLGPWDPTAPLAEF
ncbi:molybdenum cofactor biosynthesis protein [Paenibacillus arenilitoris]|uniref:Molybdopterin synthase catalytic subunit n=1 Tax=Paenibacillus arenilitoris TaxID=2772299 RepID=A0A927CUQ9_9BACL|nr:molybdenum cofactor biosynthesis protein MoaE [Paenibacillus arenilitoris]MBD2872571.1 molybdenum cofactor biosynthesis protein MoaE [Paenibacillus arenilitoris]